MAQDEQRRRERRELRMLQQESAWLQKALFALRKVQEVRDRIADLHDEEAADYVLPLDGREVAVERIEDALEERAGELLATVRERRGSMR